MTTVAQSSEVSTPERPATGSGKATKTPTVKERTTVFFYNILRRLFRLRAMLVVAIDAEKVPDDFDADRCTMVGEVVSGRDLEKLVDQQKYITAGFVARTIPKGDWCYAYFSGERLVSSGWYSAEPTRVGKQFLFTFPSEYVYMYAGYTEPDHRGARLHGHGMAAAARIVANEGKRGLIGLIDVRNFASRRSATRMGYRRVGTVFEFRILGRWFSLRTPACARIGADLKSRH